MPIQSRSSWFFSFSAALGLCGLQVGCRGELSDLEVSSPPRHEIHRQLLEALKTPQRIGPRLTGGLPHRPCKAMPAPGDRLLTTLGCEPSSETTPMSRKLRALIETMRERELRGSLGVLHLLHPVAPDGSNAVDSLESANDSAPESPTLLNDLGAAYWVRAHQLDSPRELARALETFEKALELEPSLPEALFNRALTLEALGLKVAARETWRDYVDRDPTSLWSAEATERARNLDKALLQDTWENLVAALEENRTEDLATGIARHPTKVRRLAIETLFPRWGELWLAGDRTRAGRVLETLETIGEALAPLTGDQTIQRMARAIRELESSGTGPDALAEDCAALGKGRALRKESRYTEALRYFAAARPTDAPAHPIAAWAGFWEVASLLATSNYAAARQTISSLLQSKDLGSLPALEARLLWVRGLVEVRTGFFAESLQSYLRAAEIYLEMNEPSMAGAALALSAESYRALGRSEEAWRQRFRALHLLEPTPSQSLHNLLIDSAAAARDSDWPRAGVLLQSIGVDNARARSTPVGIAEALIWRSKIWSRAGHHDHALADLESAERELAAVTDPKMIERLTADLREAQALVLLETAPERARDLLSSTLATFESFDYSYRFAPLYWARAKVHHSLAEIEEALADLESGILVFERRDLRLRGDVFRQDHFEGAGEAFDQMIDLLMKQGQVRRALHFSERARLSGRQRFADASRLLRGEQRLSDSASRELEQLSNSVWSLADDTAIIEYSLLADRLVIWRATRGEIRSWEQDVEAAELVLRIERLIERLENRAPDSMVGPELERLYRDLLGPALESLAPESRLVLVPDRALAKVPFAALKNPANGRFLVEDFVITRSLGLGVFLNAPTSSPRRMGPVPKTVLLVGDPEPVDPGARLALPAALEEAREVQALYPEASLLTGSQADEPTVTARLETVEIFHYAGHSLNDDTRPWASFLPLAPSSPSEDGRLYAHEILGRRFPRLRLVVLSGCSTVGARHERSLAVSGLGLAFLEAGVPEVVANLWDVDDQAARQLLVTFHRHLTHGSSTPEALRSAILERLRDPAGSDIADWAGLISIVRLPNP